MTTWPWTRGCVASALSNARVFFFSDRSAPGRARLPAAVPSPARDRAAARGFRAAERARRASPRPSRPRRPSPPAFPSRDAIAPPSLRRLTRSSASVSSPPRPSQKTASQHLRDLENPPANLTGHRPTPEIIEFLNICDYTHQVVSKVGVEEPLFQPFPPELGFHKYEAHKTYEQTLWFRNNDYVPRRVKIEDPRSRHFTVKRLRGKKGGVLREEADGKGSKVAPGMEVAFRVVFAPLDREDYAIDLIVATERERFVVPVRCVGSKPALDFPDALTFEPTAAKTTGYLHRAVRNVGAKRARFRAFAPEPFSVSPREGVLDVGEVCQFRLGFHPEACGTYEGEMEIELGEGLDPTVTRLRGDGAELRVGLDRGEVVHLPTFIHKTTQRTFRIVNESDRAVTFEIKQLADSYVEEEVRLRATGTFGETMRRSRRGRGGGASDDDGSDGDDGAEEAGVVGLSSDDEDAILGAEAVAFATRTVGLDKALARDDLSFSDPDFTVSPLRGEVAPNGAFEVTVRFHPTHAGERTATLWVETQGREDRLPMQLRGQAVGPLAVFAYDALEVGEIFVGAVHQYEVELVNRGEIECEYRLEPPATEAGKTFSFNPSAGVMRVGESQLVTVTLCSERLGAFDESFEFAVVGGERSAFLDFRGKVVGPKFEVREKELDFGDVAYGHLSARRFTIANLCEIPMRFALRLPASRGAEGAAEFSCLPGAGTILPFGKQTVSVEFVSTSAEKAYDERVVLDVPGVGDALATVGVVARCRVPTLALDAPHGSVVDFGETFVRREVKVVATLRNATNLPAKFRVSEQDAQSRGLARWSVTPSHGALAGNEATALTFALEAAFLGRVELPAAIHVLGAEHRPARLTLAADVRGPRLLFSRTRDGLATAFEGSVPKMHYGRVGVLKDRVETLWIQNDSDVPAEIKAFVQDVDSAFEVDAREKTLAPGEVFALNVKVHMDQILSYRDTLNVMVMEGAPAAIALEAEGVGSLITCDDFDAPNAVDFGPQLKDRAFRREIVVTNNARKLQQLVWTNVTAEEKRKRAIAAEPEFLRDIARGGKVSGDAAEYKGSKTDGEMGIVWRIEPERATVPPKSSMVFTLVGISEFEGEMQETLVCKNTAGNAKEVTGEVMIIHASASVSLPLLDFSASTLGFDYSHDPDVPCEPERRPLTMRNVSELPLTFELRPSGPFSVDKADWILDPGEAGTAAVTFDPDYRGDRRSHEVRNTLKVVYADNPHVDEVAMGADIRFPNLDVSASAIDFGSVLNDTTKRETFTVTNSGHVPARYEWVFDAYEDEDADEDERSSIAPEESFDSRVSGGDAGGALAARRARRKSRRGGASKRGTPLKTAAPEQVFDVLPIRGLLQPGETETVEISYFARADSKIEAFAVCEVEGGPSYDVALVADAHSIKYSLDATLVDFGRTPFDHVTHKTLVLRNEGKVTFPFRVNLSGLSRASVVSATPAEGVVEGRGMRPIALKIRPGIPAIVDECFTVEVAHFEPVRVAVRGEGTYHCVALSLPRLVDDEDAEFYERGERYLLDHGPNPNLPERFREHWVEPPLEDVGTLANTTLMGVTKNARPMTARTKRRETYKGLYLTNAPFLANASTGRALKDLVPPTPTPDPSTRGPTPDAADWGLDGPPYAPTEHEIAHEADRLRMVRDLIRREEERAAIRIESDREREEWERSRAEEEEAGEGGLVVVPAPPPGSAPAAGRRPSRAYSFGSRRTRDFFHGGSARASLQLHLANPNSPPPKLRGGTSSSSRGGFSFGGTPSRGGHGFSNPAAVAARYVVDFGHVAKGSRLRKTFRVQNAGSEQMQFHWDKMALQLAGFKMHPENMPKLAGAPYYSSTDVTLTLDTSLEHVAAGVVDVVVPLLVKGAPRAHVTLRAVVETPEVTPSRVAVDFGAVRIGHQMTTYVQLHNEKSVACEWSVIKPPARIKRPGEPEEPPEPFRLVPSRGALAPGERKNVKVIFAPNRHRRGREQRRAFPIRVENNPETLFLDARGTAISVAVRCEPGATLDLGAIMPAARAEGEAGEDAAATPPPGDETGDSGENGDGGEKPIATPPTVSEKAVWLVNDSGVDVEVYCVDFDEQFALDEEVLRHAEGLAEAEPGKARLLLPPRGVGEGLWPHLLEADEIRKEKEALEAERAAKEAEAEEAYAALVAEAEAKGEEPPPRPEPEPEPEEAEEAEPPPPPPPEHDDSRNVFVLAAPFAMSDESKELFAAKYRVPEMDVDALVREAAEAEGATGDAVRAELGLPPLEKEDEEDAGDGDEDENERADENADEAKADGQEEKPAAPDEENKEEEEEENQAASPEEASDSAASALGAESEEEPDDEPVEGALRVRTLAKVLAESIATTYFDGFLVDGGGCSYAPAKTVARAFVRAMRLSRAEPTPAAPPPDADETWEAPKEEEGAFVLQGGKKLAVVSLAVEDDVAGRREKAKKEADAEAAWALANPEEAAAKAEAEAEAKAREDEEGAREADEKSSDEAQADEKSSDEAQAEETSDANDEVEETSEPPYEFEAVASAAAHRDAVADLLPLFGSATAGNNYAVVVTVPTDACADAEAVLDAAVALGAPEPPKPPEWIPPDELMCVVTKPAVRERRPPATRFEILTPKAQPEWPGKKRDEEKSAEGSEGGGGGDLGGGEHPEGEADDRKEGPEDAEEEEDGGAAEEEAAEEDDGEPFSSQTRWLIKAGEATQILVRFASDAEGAFAHPLAFECVGGTRAETLELRGRSAFPSISDDYRVVHRKKTRKRPLEHEIDRVFVVHPPEVRPTEVPEDADAAAAGDEGDVAADGSAAADASQIGAPQIIRPPAPGVFEFGPLLNNREVPPPPERPEWTEGQTDEDGNPVPEPPPLVAGAHHPKRHVERFAIVNDGAFPCEVEFGARLPLDPETGEALGEDAGGVEGVFSVEPERMTLDVGETRELLVYAYPRGDLPPPTEAELEEAKRREEAEAAGAPSPTPPPPPRVNVKRGVVFAKVRDNPSEIEFPVSCVGETPRVEMDWHHPPKPEPKPVLDEEGNPRVDPETGAPMFEAPEPDPPPGVVFERQLVGAVANKRFTVKNASLLPARWRLEYPESFAEARAKALAERQAEIDATHEAALAALEEGQEPPAKPPDAVPDPEPFVFTQAGDPFDWGAHDLEPLGSETIDVSFRADAPTPLFDVPFVLRVFDVEEAMGAHQEVEVKVTAEAHVEALRVEYPRSTEDAVPQDEPEPEPETAEEAAKRRPGALDFGLVKATEPSAREFTLANDGAHAVKFAFRVRTKAARDLFALEPAEGVVEPGAEATVTMTFNHALREEAAPADPDPEEATDGAASAPAKPPRPAPREVTLKNNEDIILDVFDAETSAPMAKKTIRTSVRAAFAKYALTPTRGVAFGPREAGDENAPARAFELRNVGEFPFEFNWFDYGARSESELERDENGDVPKPPKTEGAALTLGCFTLEPPAGTIAPGEKAEISVAFAPAAGLENARRHAELAGLDVADRDPKDRPLGVPYEISGESCVPGIECEDLASVFEEHRVVPSLDPFGGDDATRDVYAVAENVFSFGPVVAEEEAPPEEAAPEETTNDEERDEEDGEKKRRERRKRRPGVAANLKISNPGKVRCSVDVALEPKGEGSDSASFPMTVLPASLEIPAHEHRYVTVYFAPRGIASYAATFSATVRGGEDPKTRGFRCELRGDGTLPHVRVEEPGGFDERTGLPTIRFPRTIVGRKVTRDVVLRNDGVLPAHVRVDHAEPPAVAADANDPDAATSNAADDRRAFELRGGGVTAELLAGRVRRVRVTFAPTEARAYQHAARLAVRRNPFEAQTIAFVGEGYEADVVFAPIDGGRRPEGTLQSQGGDSGDASSDWTLAFDDQPVGGVQTRAFALTNASKKHWRFEWPETAADGDAGDSEDPASAFAFSPRVGHLHAGATKTVTVTFAPRRATSHGGPSPEDPTSGEKTAPLEIPLALAPLAGYFEPPAPPADGEEPEPPTREIAPVDWDDRMVVEVEATEEEEGDADEGEGDGERNADASDASASASTRLVSAESSLAPFRARKVKRPMPEPTHLIEDECAKTAALRVFAVADDAKYECSANAIAFKPTVMFQARTHSVVVKNVSAATLPFEWTVCDDAAVREGRPARPSPFEVSPATGSIAPGSEATATVRFAPREVVDCKRALRCAFPGRTLAAGFEPLEISLDGAATRPWAHFELDDSDYLSHGGRRPANAPGPANANGEEVPVDPATRVVECRSLGTGTRHARRFAVLNPTSAAYAFRWADVAVAGRPAGDRAGFRCVTPDGTIGAGKRVEMVFEYCPERVASPERPDEAFFEFRVDERDVAVPFLFAGAVAEPRVAFDVPGINFGKVLVGRKHRETVVLTNHEAIPFHFAFDRDSYESKLLRFEPSSGIAPPLGDVPIQVTFVADSDAKPVNFNARVDVKRKPRALSLNVKGEGYALHEHAELESADAGGAPTRLAAAPGTNAVDLGQVLLDETKTRRVSIVNDGDLPFDLHWDVGANPRVRVVPEYASVGKGERAECELSYAPGAMKLETLENYPVRCSIVNGRTYDLRLSAEGHKPAVRFSFRRFDFGPTHVVQGGGATRPRSRVLRIRNDDRKAYAIDCLFDQAAYPFLTVGDSPAEIPPGSEAEVEMHFAPARAGRVDATVPFQINGLHVVNVRVRGEGVPLSVDLADPARHASVDFGSLKANQRAQREVVLRNDGRLPVEVRVSEACREALEEAGVRVGKSATTSKNENAPRRHSRRTEEDGSLPEGAFEIAPNGGTRAIKLAFAPKRRARPFQVPLEVVLERGVTRSVALVRGSCLGVDVSLSRETLDFGAVALGSRATKTILLQNQGDVGAAFAFDAKRLREGSSGPAGSSSGRKGLGSSSGSSTGVNNLTNDASDAGAFTITPSEGFAPPGRDVEISVTFEPASVSDDVRVDALALLVDGAGVTSSLTLGGKCVERVAEPDAIEFRCKTRRTETREIELENATASDWRLHPTVQNERCWSGAEFFEVKAGTSATYAVTFKPMSMASEESPHLGGVLFPLPDGSVVMHTLRGVADEPEPEGPAIELALPAKRVGSVAVPLTNWLKKRQRFRVAVRFEGEEVDEATGEAADGGGDPAVTLKGPDFVDLPASATREYKLAFFAHAEGTEVRATVVFTNEDTGEYASREVRVAVTEAPSLGTLELRAACRQIAKTSVRVENPLAEPVALTCACDHPRVFVEDVVEIAPNARADVEVRYRPVVVETTPSPGDPDAEPLRLVMTSDRLGTYAYDVRLSAQPAGPERGLVFNVPLGSRETKTMRFTHYLDEVTEYRCALAKGDVAFECAPSHSAHPAGPEGMEQELEVSFEPTKIGAQIRDVVMVTSETGGEYACPVVGRCVAPKPRGPVAVENGAGSFEFKNVFETETAFTLVVDNPAFVVQRTEVIGAKQTKAIDVKYQAPEGASEEDRKPRSAKVLITCAESPSPWVFYLQAS